MEATNLNIILQMQVQIWTDHTWPFKTDSTFPSIYSVIIPHCWKPPDYSETWKCEQRLDFVLARELLTATPALFVTREAEPRAAGELTPGQDQNEQNKNAEQAIHDA